MTDPRHLEELRREREHLVEVEIFLLERLDQVRSRLAAIAREVSA
jgi:hypothetical protein